MPIVPLTVENLDNGRFLTELNLAIKAAAENCLDLRMPIKGKRFVTAKLVFMLAGNRSRVQTLPMLQTTLASRQFMQFTTYVDVLNRTAQIVNEEQPTLGDWDHHAIIDCSERVPTLEDIRRGEYRDEINLGLATAIGNICDPDTPLNGKVVLEVKLSMQNVQLSTRRGKLEFALSVVSKNQPRDIAPVVVEAGTPEEEDVPLYDQTETAKEAKHA